MFCLVLLLHYIIHLLVYSFTYLPSEDGVRLPTLRGVFENGRTRNPLTLCSVPVLVHVQVWVHIPGDPQSVQLRNATTTTFTYLIDPFSDMIMN